MRNSRADRPATSTNYSDSPNETLAWATRTPVEGWETARPAAGLPCNTSSATRFRAADHLTVGTPTHGLLLSRFDVPRRLDHTPAAHPARRDTSRHGPPLGPVECRCNGAIAIRQEPHEMPALRDLLDGMDITDAVVSADAMHCQRETAN